MSAGSIARRALGPYFGRVAEVYRAFFTNLDALASVMAEHVPPGAYVIDVGGGDGAPLSRLLLRRPDVHATMLDLSPTIGGALDAAVRPRVDVRPGTSMRAYLDGGGALPDVVLVSDVLHHVRPPDRAAFFADLRALLAGGAIAIVKDVDTRGVRAALSVLADKYISGDRLVSAVPPLLLQRYFEEIGVEAVETDLRRRDHPNYAFVGRLRP